MADGWCLLGALELTGAVPESFPLNFFDEHFYYDAAASMTTAAAERVQLTLAQEAAFASGAAQANQQIVFSRLRLRFTAVPVSGNYRFMHPYGEVTIFAEAGERIFFTDDVGATCTANFECALGSSNMGPFLLPSASSGGAELGPVTAATPTPDTNLAHFPGGTTTAYPGTGKAYIADPARIGPVTGGTVRNFFRVEGPAGSNLDGAGNDFLQTNNFALMGRVYAGQIPGRVQVDRASYSNSATSRKLDVFATATPTQASRFPGAAQVPLVTATLAFHDQPCSGVPDGTGGILPPYGAPSVASTLTPMKAAGTLRWVQTQPTAIPSGVCVRDSNARDAAGNVVTTFYPAPVADEVSVTQATFNADGRSLSVNAGSSETVAALTLRLAYGADLPVNLVNGQVTVNNLLVPPPSAEVHSTKLGVTRYQVSTSYATGPGAGFPVTANDAYTVTMNTAAAPVGPQTFNVLGNDSNVAGGTITISSAPSLGSASVGGGVVSYSPNLNASGTDSFSYTVTANGNTSNPATVMVTITPVNVAPVAANDSYSGIANVQAALNVLVNDSDVNGATNIVAPVIVSGPVGATAVVSGRNVNFSAPAAGIYTFTYVARDAGINGSPALDSNTATVTVQVAAAEVLAFTQAQYERSKSRLRVSGTINPGSGQRIVLAWVDSAGNAIGTIGTVTASTVAQPNAGTWAIDTTMAAPANAVSIRATPPNGAPLNSAITFK